LSYRIPEKESEVALNRIEDFRKKRKEDPK
jgi:hypothetical protein